MLSLDIEDTITAIASAQGPGLRGVIRISGPETLDCLIRAFAGDSGEKLQIPEAGQMPGKRNASFCIEAMLPIEFQSATIPLNGTLLIWPGSRSYTRQPSAEFHTISAPPLLNLAIRKICEAGARLANPGEFTLRAFLSGRLDLPQAEAVLSVIDAQMESQMDQALRQLAGGLSGPLNDARQQLTFVLAEIEAGLDFVEEDIEFIARNEITSRLISARAALNGILSQIQSRERSAQGIQVALVGLPNSGKSSLFNELLGSQKAIVSSVSGTTTDFLVGQLDLDGIEIELIDTAGKEDHLKDYHSVDSSKPSIGQLAQLQREAISRQASVRLFCINAARPLDDWELAELRLLNDADTDRCAATILVITHGDKVSLQVWRDRLFNEHGLALDPLGPDRLMGTSVPSNHGLQSLRTAIRQLVLAMIETQYEMVGATVLRSSESLRSASASIQSAILNSETSVGDEVIAADIRLALDELSLVAGTVYTDDILDIVFSRFCIGK